MSGWLWRGKNTLQTETKFYYFTIALLAGSAGYFSIKASYRQPGREHFLVGEIPAARQRKFCMAPEEVSRYSSQKWQMLGLCP